MMQCEALASSGGGVPGFALWRCALQTANIANSGDMACVGHVMYSQAGEACPVVLNLLHNRTDSYLASTKPESAVTHRLDMQADAFGYATEV